MTRKNFIELDNLESLFRYCGGFRDKLQKQLATKPYTMTILDAQEKIQMELARIEKLALDYGAIKIYLLLSKGYSLNPRSQKHVNSEVNKIQKEKGTKALESFLNHLQKDRGSADFALNLLASLDLNKDQNKIKLIAKDTNLAEQGIISSARLVKDGPAIGNTDLVRIAVSKNLKNLFMKAIENLDHTASDILDSSVNLGIPNDWCMEALKNISPEKNIMAFKLLLKEAEIDALDPSILRSYEDFPALKVLKALVLSNDLELFKKVMKLLEGIADDSMTIQERFKAEEEYNGQLKDLAQLAYECESTEILSFMALILLSEDDDSDSFELFDDIVSKLGGVNAVVNDQDQTIFQLIIEHGNLDLLIHAKEKFLQDPLLQQEAISHRDSKGLNSVHFAAHFQDDSYMEELSLMSGFNQAVNVNSMYGYPLYISCKNKDFSESSVPYLLLTRGADVTISFSKVIDLLKKEIETAKSEGAIPAVYAAFDRALDGEYPIPVPMVKNKEDTEIDNLIEALELGMRNANEICEDAVSISSDISGNSDSGCEMPDEEKSYKKPISTKEVLVDFVAIQGGDAYPAISGESASHFDEIQL